MEFNETPRNIYKNGYSETSTRMTGQCNQVAERFFFAKFWRIFQGILTGESVKRVNHMGEYYFCKGMYCFGPKEIAYFRAPLR